MMAHDAGGGIDREGHDLLWRVVRDVLDVDAAFGGDHERYFGGFAVDQDRQIKLLIDVGAFLDVEAVDLLAMRPGLHRDQRRAEHLLGKFIDLGDRFGDAHAALIAGGSFLELALATAAGVDLALHHPDRAAELFRRYLGIRRPQHRKALRDGHAEFMEQRLCLVFMDIHWMFPDARTVTLESASVLRLAYHIPQGRQTQNAPKHHNLAGFEKWSPKINGWIYRIRSRRVQRPSRSGAIFLQAS